MKISSSLPNPSLFNPLLIALTCILFTGCVTAVPIAEEAPTTTREYPTLDDYWDGKAEFVVEAQSTGLPMGESDTLELDDGRLLSYIHASGDSAGVIDQCGDPVVFPGCIVLLASEDHGNTFVPLHLPETDTDQQTPTCLIPCRQCPCDSQIDHIDQQQYPQVVRQIDDHGEYWIMAYEYRANTFLRRSQNGIDWSLPEEVPMTGIWADWLMPCRTEEKISVHPYTELTYDCLIGSPPGLTVATNEFGEEELFLFVGLGQNPGSMGCYRGTPGAPASLLRKCDHNPLFTGSLSYGPTDLSGPDANPTFDFRTVSSADVLKVGDRFYMFYEGVRGPGAGDAGDTQFGLGLARSVTDQIDGPWELLTGNPILIDLPGNVGVGHADVIVIDGRTTLYTSLDGETRRRLVLQWQ